MHRHWSGKHHAVVDGIHLITMVWTDSDTTVPCDWRVFDKSHDGTTNNEHLATMLLTAKGRGFAPECVLFDSWCAGIDNLRLVRDCDWRWLTQLKGNRLVNVERAGHRPIVERAIAETGTVVWLKDYGLIHVFRILAPHSETDHWAASDLTLGELARLKYAELSWSIEV